MTTPLGMPPTGSRQGEPRPGVVRTPAAAAAPLARGGEPQRTGPSDRGITPGELKLLEALAASGQFGRALTLLETLWHHEVRDERCWYLRLWALAGQGRVPEALELVRAAAAQLPGSAALAYLHAVLEHAAGDRSAAIEAALRSAAILPGRVESEALLDLVLAADRTDGAVRTALPASVPSPEIPFNPVAMALAGLALAHPSGSARALQPQGLAREIRVAQPREGRAERRRFWLIGVATILAALWAVRDPLPATVALAGAVAWLSRPPRRDPR